MAIFVGKCSDDEDIVMDICDGRFQMVYICPNTFLSDMLERYAAQSPHHHNNLVALIVDEAHCVTKCYILFHIVLVINYNYSYQG